MRIPGADQAIGHLIKWSEKDEWEPYRRQVFAEHFELIMERFDISEQEIVDEETVLGNIFREDVSIC
jgi:hypothetical protein